MGHLDRRCVGASQVSDYAAEPALTRGFVRKNWFTAVSSGFPVYRYARGPQFGLEYDSRYIWEEGKPDGDSNTHEQCLRKPLKLKRKSTLRGGNPFDSSESEERNLSHSIPPPRWKPLGRSNRKDGKGKRESAVSGDEREALFQMRELPSRGSLHRDSRPSEPDRTTNEGGRASRMRASTSSFQGEH